MMIFLDTETTGLLRPEVSEAALQPRIIEICAVKTDESMEEEIDCIETFIDPVMPIPEEITRITGIKDADVLGAPKFVMIYEKLAEFFLGETIVVAHNCAFDMGMIEAELKRIDKVCHFPWPKDWICTVEATFFVKNKRMKLTDAHEHFTGKPHNNGAHRAKNDVYALMRLYAKLKNQKLV